jgi:hypothetical protein
MNAYKIQTILTENGQLTLENIPFLKGELVEVIILKNNQHSSSFNGDTLAGKVIKYDDPYEPATDIKDWEVLSRFSS